MAAMLHEFALRVKNVILPKSCHPLLQPRQTQRKGYVTVAVTLCNHLPTPRHRQDASLLFCLQYHTAAYRSLRLSNNHEQKETPRVRAMTPGLLRSERVKRRR